MHVNIGPAEIERQLDDCESFHKVYSQRNAYVSAPPSNRPSRFNPPRGQRQKTLRMARSLRVAAHVAHTSSTYGAPQEFVSL